jgi:hypothetical protein
LSKSGGTCRDIVDGRYDELPAEAFYFSDGIAKSVAKSGER